VSLFVNIWVAVIGSFLTIDARMGRVMKRGVLQNTESCLQHRIKISNRRATQRCNVSAFFYAKICSLLARRRSNQPVQRVYWPENVIDWLGKWRPTCVMRHARGQKLQSFRRKWPFYMDLYSMLAGPLFFPGPARGLIRSSFSLHEKFILP
jgi:hypothetical protein